jgi:hypothetical protein
MFGTVSQSYGAAILSLLVSSFHTSIHTISYDTLERGCLFETGLLELLLLQDLFSFGPPSPNQIHHSFRDESEEFVGPGARATSQREACSRLESGQGLCVRVCAVVRGDLDGEGSLLEQCRLGVKMRVAAAAAAGLALWMFSSGNSLESLTGGWVTWTRLGIVGTGLLALSVHALVANQDKLLYQPRALPEHMRPQDNPHPFQHPGQWDIKYRDVEIQSRDGIKLRCWFMFHEKPNEERPTLLFFQGNAASNCSCECSECV